MHVGFKSVELAGEISSCQCGQTDKDVTMEFPFMIQMLGTPSQVPNTKQGKMPFLLLKKKKNQSQQKNNCFLPAYRVDCIKELLCLIFFPFF